MACDLPVVPPMNICQHVLKILSNARMSRGDGVGARGTVGRRYGFLKYAVLGVYLLANIGLPVGGFNAAGLSKGCRCSADVKAAGKCCCAQKTASLPGRGCCATKPVVTQSCCKSKSNSLQAHGQIPSHEVIDSVSECPCGPGQTPLYLVCAQPRILMASLSSLSDAVAVEWLTAFSVSPCGGREPPTVPPPEVLV